MVSTLLGGAPQVAQPSASPTPKTTPTPKPAADSVAVATTDLPAANSAERSMFEALNAERLRQGLTPVAWSYELATAAAAHSADMARNDFLEHEGSDGSTPRERAARTGYLLPPGTNWLVIEGISAMPTWESALDWLLTDALHRRVLLRSVWREVGIGYVQGGRYGNYWTLDFGCRPNVLPVFATPRSDGQTFALTFTNENCAANGGGPTEMGSATNVMFSTRRDFRDGTWEPFADTKVVQRPQGRDLNVRLRDDSGRLSAPVRLVLDATPQPSSATMAGTVVPDPTPTPKPAPATPTKAAKAAPVPTIGPSFFPPLQP